MSVDVFETKRPYYAIFLSSETFTSKPSTFYDSIKYTIKLRKQQLIWKY